MRKPPRFRLRRLLRFDMFQPFPASFQGAFWSDRHGATERDLTLAFSRSSIDPDDLPQDRLIPTPIYVLVITIALWIAVEYTPIGRYLYAINANQRAAELNGIPTRKLVTGAFVTSGLMTVLAGVLLALKLCIGQASVGLKFLLPALVGAFPGSTTIKPGRVNVWGTAVTPRRFM